MKFKKSSPNCILSALILSGIITTQQISFAADVINQTRYDFNIPAQPITRSINMIANQGGYAVILPEGENISQQGVAIQGKMTISEALNLLLANSSFKYTFTNKTIQIEKLPVDQVSNSGTTLATITATTAIDQEKDGTKTFVAKHSKTGTKTNANLLETPQTVNVITAQEMTALKPQKVGEALRYTPGVVTESQQNTSYFDRTRIRGFYSITNNYFDGMQLTPSGTIAVAQIDPFLLDRIEVLKGPSSVLYGQNDAGGIINMQSKRPQFDSKNELGFRYGSDNFKETNLDSTGSLNEEGTLAYRVVGLARSSGSYIDHAKTERFAIAPSITWKPSAQTSWTVLSAYQHDPAGISSGSLPAVGTILPNINGQISRNVYVGDRSWDNYNRDQTYISSEFEHQFNDKLTFRQNLRWINVSVNSRILSPGTLSADQTTISRTAQTSDAKTRGISIDNNLLYKYQLGSTSNEMIVGYDFRRFRNSNLSATGTNSSLNLNLYNPQYGNVTIPTLTTRTSNDITLEQSGVYAQNQMAWQQWRLTAGVRYDTARNETDNYLTKVNRTQNDHALTGRAGLTYLFNNGVAPYVSYATSFEPTIGTDYYGNSFQPTKGKQWEAGVKYAPEAYDMLLTAAAYDLTKTNVSTTDPLHSTYSVQTGKVGVQGIELEAKFNLTDSLKTTLAYTLMSPEVKQSNTGNVGKLPTNTPRQMASAWVNYQFNQLGLNGFSVGMGARYIGKMYADDMNTKVIKPYTVMDAMMSYNLGHILAGVKNTQLSLSITNLTDKKVVGGCLSQTSCDYVPARTIIGSVNFQF